MNKLIGVIVLQIVVSLAATVSYAQFLEGTKTAGGGIGFSAQSSVRQNVVERKASEFFLNGNGGYLLEDNIEVGFNAGISFTSRYRLASGGNEEIRSGLFQLGPYARLYNPITDVVGLFGEGGFTVGFGGGSGIRRRSFEAGIRPGVILMVNQNLGLETTIGFIGYKREAFGNKNDYSDSRVAINSFRATFDLSTINFGFRLYLRD